MAGAKRKTLQEIAAEHAQLNDALARRLGERTSDAPPSSEPPPPTDGSGYTVRCSTCSAPGPPAPTIYEAAMLAQRRGFTYDSGSLRVGKRVLWFCPAHERKKP